MIVRTARNKPISVTSHTFGKSFRIAHYLLLVSLETGLQSFVKTDRLSRDHVHERAPLNAGKNLRIDFLRVFFFAQDQTTARAPEGFVGCSRYKIGVFHRAGMFASNDQPGD